MKNVENPMPGIFKFGSIPLAFLLTISAVTCRGGKEIKHYTDCGPSGENSVTVVLHEDEIIDLIGIPVQARSGKLRIQTETFDKSNVIPVARHKFRVNTQGGNVDVSMGGQGIAIEAHNKKITAKGIPIHPGATDIQTTINTKCNI